MSSPKEDSVGLGSLMTYVFVPLTLWFLLFAVGTTVESEPFRKVVSRGGAAAIEGAGGSDARPALTDTLRSLLSRLEDRDSLLVVQATPKTQADSESSQTKKASSGSTRSSGADSTENDHSFLWKLWSFFVVLICFTPLNLALLCCTAGVLGAVGRWLQLSIQENPDARDNRHPFLSAVVRGLFVFLIVISGTLVLLENPILSTASPGQYVRFAGLLSLTSFVVNYDPRVFLTLFDQVRERLQERSERSASDEEGEATPDEGESV